MDKNFLEETKHKNMAEAQGEEKEHGNNIKMETKDDSNNNNNNNNPSSGTTSDGFKFNAQAPEFVPRSYHQQFEIPCCYYPYFQVYGGGTSGSHWLYVGDQQDPTYHFFHDNTFILPNCTSTNFTGNNLQHKILKQVEYLFSDINLLANETMAKHISKEADGFVPISTIASIKKIKSLTSNIQTIAQALRSSSKLVVSSDGKKVKRKKPFTEKDKEELQSRTVVVENLPEDYSYQNLEKIFHVVGSVKNIRICHPQESASSRSKGDFFFSNKIHALIEYENTETAEMAIEKLNDEKNWRKGLRVRLLLRCSPKSVLKNRKSEFDSILEDEDALLPESNDCSQSNNHTEANHESNAEEHATGSKKGSAKGRGKSRARQTQTPSGRGLIASSPQPNNTNLSEVSTKPALKGPKMPDGTKGFAVGRGKPLTTSPSLGNSP